jgi:hypothetical protein
LQENANVRFDAWYQNCLSDRSSYNQIPYNVTLFLPQTPSHCVYINIDGQIVPGITVEVYQTLGSTTQLCGQGVTGGDFHLKTGMSLVFKLPGIEGEPTSGRVVTPYDVIINAYTLHITAVHGTVTQDPYKTTYAQGESTVLTAQPSPGYRFSHWEQDLSGTTNPTKFYFTGPDVTKEVTAVFTRDLSHHKETTPKLKPR